MLNMIHGSPMVAFWLVTLIGAIVAEAVTLTSLVAVWFIPGILLALILALCKVGVGFQVAACLISSLLCVVFTKPLAEKYLNRKTKPTNFDRVIGNAGLVSKEIDNLKGTGTVVVDGKEWTARSIDGSVIASGEKVVIDRIEGVKIIVRRAEDGEE